MHEEPILVTGATGYVSGRLIPALLKKGYRIRAMGRDLDKLARRPWARDPRVETVYGDVLDAASLKNATTGCRAAFYLVHSMIARKEKFAAADRLGAQNMVDAAASTGLERIIYLGGLAEVHQGGMSKHLKSRIEVAKILGSGPVKTTVLRAPMILGSGSASFEILRYLVERLPIMTPPRWVFSLTQPIAIRNVVTYLIGCLENDETTGQTFDIGGPDVMTYRGLLDIYAREAGLFKRIIIPVPVLTPTLSALWINFISPVPKSIALPLTEGLTSDAVCTENRIQELIPQKLIGCREAIALSLDRIPQFLAGSCGQPDNHLLAPEWPHHGDPPWAGGTVKTCGYRATISSHPEAIWQLVSRIGGDTGYYFADRLWRFRGLIDRLAGGVGMRKGRGIHTDPVVGDALDFWRVAEVKNNRRLVLVSEMKTPGEALLEIDILGDNKDRTILEMTSTFFPKGSLGLLYWYVLYPFHQWVFWGMLKGIAGAVKRPILEGPEKFMPTQHPDCPLPTQSRQKKNAH